MTPVHRTMREVFALRRNGYSGPFFVGLMLLLSGIQLLLSADTFSTADSYEVMSHWATEQGWGAFLVACSLIIIISSLNRKPREVALGALVAGFGWLVITVSVFLGNPTSILLSMSGVLVLRCMSIYREFKTQFDPITGEPYLHT